MDFKDCYAIMGVAREATQDEIKRACRKLARKCHPDVSKDPDAEVRFKEIGGACEVLKDPDKRAACDQLGRGYRPGEEVRPPPDWDAGFEFSCPGFDGGVDSGCSDFFEAMFARRRGGRGRHEPRRRGDCRARGQDHHARALIGRGVLGTPPGDLYAVLQIVLPPAQTDAARQAWRELQEKVQFDPRATLES